MLTKVECLVSEAFMDSEVCTTSDTNETKMKVEIEQQTTMIMANQDSSSLKSSQETQRSALRTTLGIASSAASFVLFPYVVAGKVAVYATSTVVRAPVHLTNQVRASIAQSWTRSIHDYVDTDLFDEDFRSSTSSSSGVDNGNEQVMESFEKVTNEGENYNEYESGVVSQLLHLPLRLVHSSVSTVVAIPKRIATCSGRKLSGAVSTSHAFATSAVVASTSSVARTGVHVARGITHGAVSTASFAVSAISGAVGASVRTVSYAIPPSVSNAVWKGMDITGNASVNVLSNAIAVPSYRMLQALVPAINNCFSEEDVVNETRTMVKMLVNLLGPQNAFYLLKWAYETINSEEAHDALLLCGDIMHESLDGENYRLAGASASTATGFTMVMHTMKETYSVLPSFDELLDAVVLVADISNEVVDGVAHVVSKERDLNLWDESRFKYVYADEEPCLVEPTETTFERQESNLSSEEERTSLFESGLLMLTRACDSEEASSLFNTFDNFLDVMID
ncbi:unnamed protein product [Peronospora farinosa]|uniref:Uncharacterized protein n=1 Tax=Peronospora farinosa TaxID=134698 RepID=A0AAV0SP35_9STRA|nr:unnamed protein product [Peronospora farinosa]CAI5704488.1 unnamed protein product [Peronospora farinosa]